MPFAVYDYIVFVFLIIAFIWDIWFKKLPNWLTASGMVLGLIYHLIVEHVDGLLFSFIGFLVGGGLMLLLYFFHAVGAGDVKLFAAIGAFVGVPIILYGMMYSIIYAGIIGLFILLFTRRFMTRMINALFQCINSMLSKNLSQLEYYKKEESLRFPFMYAVLPAFITTYYFTITL